MAMFTNASSLSKVQKLAGLYLTGFEVDQFSMVLPQHPIDGHELVIPIAEEENMPTAAVLVVDEQGSGSELIADAIEPKADLSDSTFGLSRIGGDIQVASQLTDTYGNLNDLRELQIYWKKVAILSKIGDLYMNGSGANGEFKGLANLIVGDRDLSELGSGEPLLVDIDHLASCIEIDAAPDFLIASRFGISNYLRSCYANGVAPETISVTGFDRPLIAHCGVPFLRCDHIPTDEEVVGQNTVYTGYIYAVSFGWGRGICGIYPATQQGVLAEVKRLPTPDYDNERFRVVATCGLSRFRCDSLARLSFTITVPN